MEYDEKEYAISLFTLILEGINNGKIVPLSLDISAEMRDIEPENGWCRHEDTGERAITFKWKIEGRI